MYMMIVPRRNFNLFDDFFDDPFFQNEEKHTHAMPLMKTNVRETDKNYLIDIDLPGFDKKDIKIDIENGYLNIHAKTDNSHKEEKGKFLRRERYMGECSRSFYIGDEITEEEIKATFKNGVLSLEVPKVEEKKKLPEKKYIEIGE